MAIRKEQGLPYEPEVIEGKRKPQIQIWITRHAERMPTGELTPEGIAAAKAKGEKVNAEVVKGWSSLEKSDRAYTTLQEITKGSGIISARTGLLYETRRRVGLFYDIAGPLEKRVKKQTELINEAVKRDNPDYDPESKDPKWAKIRTKYQPIGIRNIIADKEMSYILAMGLAYQFSRTNEIGKRYVAQRESALERGENGARPIEKDIILNIGTHGGFIESFLRKTMIRIGPDGREKRGFEISRDEKGEVKFEEALGGIFLPIESIRVGYPVADAKEMPKRLPIEFESDHFKGERCYLDISLVHQLAKQFEIYLELLGRWKNKEIGEEDFISAVNKLGKEFRE